MKAGPANTTIPRTTKRTTCRRCRIRGFIRGPSVRPRSSSPSRGGTLVAPRFAARDAAEDFIVAGKWGGGNEEPPAIRLGEGSVRLPGDSSGRGGTEGDGRCWAMGDPGRSGEG